MPCPLSEACLGQGADHVVVTSDNPRGEPPASIIDEVVAGIPAETPPTVVEDRAEAIRAAFAEAAPGDIVVIAGKGHETTQTIGDAIVDFDDRQVARTALEELL